MEQEIFFSFSSLYLSAGGRYSALAGCLVPPAGGHCLGGFAGAGDLAPSPCAAGDLAPSLCAARDLAPSLCAARDLAPSPRAARDLAPSPRAARDLALAPLGSLHFDWTLDLYLYQLMSLWEVCVMLATAIFCKQLYVVRSWSSLFW